MAVLAVYYSTTSWFDIKNILQDIGQKVIIRPFILSKWLWKKKKIKDSFPKDVLSIYYMENVFDHINGEGQLSLSGELLLIKGVILHGARGIKNSY